jgi:E3 ubiquitin-protein ligase DOA10
VVAEEDVGAGIPDLPKPKAVGGLTGNIEQNRQAKDSTEVQCRICLDEESKPSNPLITPCKCIGSVRFIHLDCLRSWLSLKKQEHKERGVQSYYWEQLQCELCKTVLNLKQITGGDS